MNTVSSSTAELVISFRDGGEPRALATRMIALARRHPRGWTVDLASGDRFECTTFDTVAQIVADETGAHRLLIVWPGTDAS